MMKHSIKKWLFILLLPFIFSWTHIPNNNIKEGKYRFTCQFVNDKSGSVSVYSQNDTLFLNASTIAIDTASFVVMKGHIEKIEKDSFVFVGKIRTYAGDACCGYIVKNGAWTFRRMLNRNFYRLKERDSLCDCYTCCFYIDIHLK
jgi:hypothetical protein